MLYHIFYQLLSEKYSYLNVFKYLSFRSICSFLFTFLIVIIVQPFFIIWLKNLGIKGQPIRDDGPKDHESKKGTPTMGGLVVIGAVFLSTILFCNLTEKYVWLTTFVMIAFTALGFFDDWSKVTKQNAGGITERQKLVTQVSISIIVAVLLIIFGFSTDLNIPLNKNYLYPLGLLFIPFVVLVIVGTSNAVNLTDGLDGLAIGPVMTVAITYGVFAYLAGNSEFAQYLKIPYVPGVGEVCIILAALFGGGLGFLWYNTFPAQVFMGDTGALAMGGMLAVVAIIVKQEIALVIAGGVFVIETISVIIQRYYYKLTKKRVFRMAPIHHHYELSGWAEPKIIVRFWIISIILALIALSTLKLR